MSDQRLKVLLIVEATAAGVGRHVSDIVLNIDLNRFDVTLAWSPVRSDELFRTNVELARQRGIRIEEVPMARAVNPRKDLVALARLTQLILQERFDLIHGHSSKAGLLARMAGRLARKRAVTVYSPNAISIPINPLYWYPEKAAGWLTDAIIAVSDSEHNELAGYGLVPARKIRTVTAGIPPACQYTPEQHREVRDSFHLPQDSLIIATVGRIAPQKDPQTFVEVAARIISRGLPAHFVWIGDGEQRHELERELRERRLSDRVRLLGFRPDVQRILAAADIFLLTSRYESFGYVTCEAMALGKPVVASRVTGSCEVVEDGVTGTLVPPEDCDQFVTALETLILDSGLRTGFGNAGRDRVHRLFSLSRMVGELEQLYLELSNGKRNRVPHSDSIRSSVEVA